MLNQYAGCFGKLVNAFDSCQFLSVNHSGMRCRGGFSHENSRNMDALCAQRPNFCRGVLHAKRIAVIMPERIFRRSLYT